MDRWKTKIERLLIGLVLLSVLFLLFYLLISALMPDLFPLIASQDRDAIEEALKGETGGYAALLTIVMQFLQTFSIVIPGMPINVASGLVFGGVIGTFICTAGFVAANMAVFLFAEKLGVLVSRILPGAKGESRRWQWIRESDKPVRMIMLAYAIPGLPNGFIPYMAARLHVSMKQFALAVLCGSLPGIAFSNFIGHFLLEGNYRMVMILALCWLLFFVGLLMNQRIIRILTR
ncbi:MAG: TVP38/TMEM64 family protein [Bacillus sp. (in: firmicutes)]